MERECPLIPQDIIFDILLRLPIKLLCRFKCVSKQWLALMNNPLFIEAHLERSKKYKSSQNRLIIATRSSLNTSYSFQPPNGPISEHGLFFKHRFKLLCSCNGILLLGDRNDVPFSLWNPSTRTYRIISSPPGNPRSSNSVHGLGYDPIRDEFKIFTVTNNNRSENRLSPVYVLSSRSNSWKRIQDFPYPKGPKVESEPLIVVNGSPHWVVRSDTERGSDFVFSCIRFVVLCFDPHEETFKVVPHPKVKTFFPHFKLTSLGGNLCVVDDHEEGLDVWVRKESTWSMLFFIPKSTYEKFLKPLFSEERDLSVEFYSFQFQPLCFAGEGDDEVVAVIAGVLVVYDLREKRLKRIDIPRHCGQYFDVVCYMESLISPFVGFGKSV